MDPEHGDYRPAPGSAAASYGCQTFLPAREQALWRQVPESFLTTTTAALLDGPRSLELGRVEVAGSISADSVWDADTVSVIGDVVVENGVTLTVAPGTRVEFADFYSLSVLGRILAVGSADDPIVFTTDEPEAFLPDSTTAGSWNGVRFLWTLAQNGESRLEHCVLEYSKAVEEDACGGALRIIGFSGVLVRDCIIRSCVADYGAAVFCSHQASPRFVGVLFQGNTALVGGSAVYNMYAYPSLTSCTIAGNSALDAITGFETGAVHNHISKPRTTGSIVWGNTSTYFLSSQIFQGKPYYTTFSDIEGGHEGEGNFDADPLFVGVGSHPYALDAGSPCTDAGPPDTLGLRLPAVDLAGSPRLTGGRIDAGSYEGAGGTGVTEEPVSAERLVLCRPNPFVRSTRVSFELPGACRVSAAVYDAAGRRVKTLLDRRPTSGGAFETSWDGADDAGRDVPSGLYFLRIDPELGPPVESKLVLLR